MGISTLVFVLSGAEHTAVFLRPSEGDALLEYCSARNIDTSALRLLSGPSDELLPRIGFEGLLDVMWVDGSHAFPFPFFDWYYGCRSLRAGGLLVVDDTQLPAPAYLAAVLAADRRWSTVSRRKNWAAFERLTDHDLREEWTEQRHSGLEIAARAAWSVASSAPRHVLGRLRK